MLDVEEAAESRPQGGGELGPAVRCDDCWDPIAAHPSLKLAQSTVVVLFKGIASGQRDVLSMMVNR